MMKLLLLKKFYSKINSLIVSKFHLNNEILEEMNNDDYLDTYLKTSGLILTIFFIIVLIKVIKSSLLLFLPKFGRRHRLFGLVYLCLLTLGIYDIANSTIFNDTSTSIIKNYFYYDFLLSSIGILLTLTAAYDFKNAHSNIINPITIKSGTLHQSAIVSFNEMIEHVFYQILNLIQAIFIHYVPYYFNIVNNNNNSCGSSSGSSSRSKYYNYCYYLLPIFLVTSLWYFRYLFPVHSFSANYDENRGGGKLIKNNHVNSKNNNNNNNENKFFQFINFHDFHWENVMYMIKKHQYLFYKHFLLHGLNIVLTAKYAFAITMTSNSNIISNNYISSNLGTSFAWRLYWLSLNTAYTMEFFLQTLVRRGHLHQPLMLMMNQLLMIGSSIAAIRILSNIYCNDNIHMIMNSNSSSNSSGMNSVLEMIMMMIMRWIYIIIPLLSWFLNYYNRKKEMVNVTICSSLAIIIAEYIQVRKN